MTNYITYTAEGKILLPNIKQIFIPDEGKELADADLSGADIQVVAADSHCKWLLDYFSKPQDKKVYAYIASEFFQRDISDKSDEYKMYKGVFHGCVTADHEVLTKDGWVYIKDLATATAIAVWNPEDKNMFFEIPKGINNDYVRASEPLYQIKSAHLNFLGTQDHTFPYLKSTSRIAKEKATQLNATAKIPLNGFLTDGEVKYTDAYIKFLVATHVLKPEVKQNETGRYEITWKTQSKKTYIKLKNILIENKFDIIEKKEGKNSVLKIFIPWFFNHIILDWGILNFSQENLALYVEEVQQWHSRNQSFTSEDVTILHTLAHLVGKTGEIRKNSPNLQPNHYSFTINKIKHTNLDTSTREFISHKGTKVYCPQTSTGYFIIRRKGKIYISGNTNYLLGVEKLAKMSGITARLAKQLQEFYFKLNPEVKQWHKRLENDIKTKGYTRNQFGRRMQFFYGNGNPNLMNEVAASIPQSTIADLINKAWVNIRELYPEVDVLMQVHDSLLCQYDMDKAVFYREKILEAMRIPVPYDTPLYIDSDIKVSTISYGDTKKISKVSHPT
jgi:hypothetical protein